MVGLEGLPAVPEAEEEEVVGAEAPTVIEWEDLQQELARLWSLSSEVKKARETKDALARKLETVIQVRRDSLAQLNELDVMRKKVEDRKLVMGDLVLRAKRMSDDVRIGREELCYGIRWLLVAGKTLSAAHQQLQDANVLLTGERGHGHLRKLQTMLKSRQQYMVTQVSILYPVKSSTSQTDENSEPHSAAIRPRNRTELPSPNASMSSLLSSCTILGLQPITPPVKKMSFFGDKKEAQKSSASLGYIAHAVCLFASYMDVLLRYPIRLGGSRSYILDYAPYIEPTAADFSSNSIIATTSKTTDFPLFLEGQDTTRAAYAMFLLNKDIEQLLNSTGAQSLGPRHLLANLREIVRIIRSPDYVDK